MDCDGIGDGHSDNSATELINEACNMSTFNLQGNLCKPHLNISISYDRRSKAEKESEKRKSYFAILPWLHHTHV